MRQCLANQQWDTDLPRCVPANNKGGSDNETKVAPRPKMNPETRSMKKVCKEGFQNDTLFSLAHSDAWVGIPSSEY